jgi:tetratricopeptide (TPR) repeat protein
VDFTERNFDKAIRQFQRAVALEERSNIAHDWLGRGYEATGQYRLALDQFEIAEKLEHPAHTADVTSSYARYRSALATHGARGMWQARLDDVLHWQTPDSYLAAKLYARLGQTNEVFAWLERARLERDNNMIMLFLDDCWDPYRDESRFKTLLQEMGLRDMARRRNSPRRQGSPRRRRHSLPPQSEISLAVHRIGDHVPTVALLQRRIPNGQPR